MGVDLAGTQQAGHRSGDHLAALLLLTAHRQHHGKAGCYQLCIKLRRFILFVDKRNGWTACATLCKLQIFPRGRLRAIEHSQDQACLLQLFPAAADALGFNGIFGLAQTGGIEQIQLDIPQLYRLFHHVTGGASHRRDDGPVEPGQQVEQCGFARIWSAHNGAVHTFAQDGIRLIIMDQLVQLCLYPTQYAVQMVTIQLRHIFFGKIHPCGKVSLNGGKRFLLGTDLLCQRTAQRGIGQRGTLTAIRRDQIHDGFGLRQTQLAVQERAAGVLAGRGRLSTGSKTGFHQTAGHGAAAMAGKLHHVFAGIAVGRAEKQGHALIKGFVPFPECAVHGGVAFGILHLFCGVGRAEHPGCYGIALRTGEPHDGNAACARRCCNGCNGRFLHGFFWLPFRARSGRLLPSAHSSETNTVSLYHEMLRNGTVFSTNSRETVENPPVSHTKKGLSVPTRKAPFYRKLFFRTWRYPPW